MTIKEQIISLFDRLSDKVKDSLLQEINYKEVSETLLIEETLILSCLCVLKVSWTKYMYELHSISFSSIVALHLTECLKLLILYFIIIYN